MVVNVTVFFFLLLYSNACKYYLYVYCKGTKIIEKKADRVYHKWKLAKEPFLLIQSRRYCLVTCSCFSFALVKRLLMLFIGQLSMKH